MEVQKFMNEIIPLFSTPLYFSKIENLDNEEIFSQIDQLNYTESYSKMLLSSEEYIIDRFPKLKQNIIDHTNVYLFDRLGFEPFKYYFSDSWFVIVNPSGKSKMHLHSNSLYSGIVYLNVSDDGGKIKFYSTETNSTKNTVKYIFKNKENNLLNSESWSISPSSGDILIFPSYLLHEVTKNESNNNRYSFAFNIFPENYRHGLAPGVRVTDR